MANKRAGIPVFFVGLTVMALSAIMGKVLQSRLFEVGMTGFQQDHGIAGMVLAMVFFFSFPVGLVICLMGAVTMSKSLTGRVWPFALLIIPGIAIVILVPVIFGRGLSASYFGIGGVSILVLSAATIYYWGAYRARQPGSRHAALDLQAIGYFCFALAAWNSCGFGSVPSFALFPEKMIALGSRDFAVGQLKSIMAFFVLGWLFTMLGFFKASRAGGRSS